MKDYTECMLANAHNNWRINKGEKLLVVTTTQACIDDPRYELLRKMQFEERGVTERAVNDVPREELVAAMEWYEKNTDWSAFKRKDWQAAMDSLN